MLSLLCFCFLYLGESCYVSKEAQKGQTDSTQITNQIVFLFLISRHFLTVQSDFLFILGTYFEMCFPHSLHSENSVAEDGFDLSGVQTDKSHQLDLLVAHICRLPARYFPG